MIIRYCEMCGGAGQAKEIAAQIKKYLGIEPELVDVGRGRLEVVVDDEIIWEKKGAKDWHPKDIVRLIKHRFK
jgi:hypothetical protein